MGPPEEVVMWKVYGLVDPRDGEVRYVGCTTQKWLSNRLAGHMNSARLPTQRGHLTKRSEWIREVLADGQRPTIVQLQAAFTKEEALEVENSWIERFGFEQLVNQKGAGPKARVTQEVRDKLSASGKKQWEDASPEKRAAVAEQGRKTIAQARESWRGKHHTDEAKQKMREARLRKVQTEREQKLE